MVSCEHLVRTFATRAGPFAALDDVSFRVARGEFLAVQGPSGSGKSTLLLALGGMLRPSSGTVAVDGQDPYAMSSAARARFRAAKIGFVFQLFHLVPYLDVRRNILAGLPRVDAAARDRVEELIAELGLSPRAGAAPATLSAGERQRVALARALAKQPPLILADEPTGNLDPDNAAAVFRRLAAYQRAGGTVIVVTHGTDAATHANRVLRLRAGSVEGVATEDAGGERGAASPESRRSERRASPGTPGPDAGVFARRPFHFPSSPSPC